MCSSFHIFLLIALHLLLSVYIKFCSSCFDPASVSGVDVDVERVAKNCEQLIPCFTQFIETPRSFTRSCLKGKRGVYSNDTDAKMTTVNVRYNPNLVKKAVHIFRNPFDNAVARFHLDRKIRAHKNRDGLVVYPNNKDGFHEWCTELNANAQVLTSIHWIDSSLAASMKGLPCLTEFYLYVQWHNLAFATISDLQVPSFTFNYEDYTDRFEAVTDELINFLEVKRVGEAPEFINNKKYGEYYTAQEKHAIATFIKEFATKATWQRVEHYLNDFLDEPKEGVESTV
jgi:hypothetical protein